MIDFIRRLFCNHEWKDVSGRVKVWDSDISSEHPVSYERTYVCKKCLKKKTIRY